MTKTVHKTLPGGGRVGGSRGGRGEGWGVYDLLQKVKIRKNVELSLVEVNL